MTRFLFAAMPAAGHVGPMIPLAHELVARGHEVAWYTGERYRDKVEATGATFLPHPHAMRVDVARLDDDFPARAQKKSVAATAVGLLEELAGSVGAAPDNEVCVRT